MSIINSNKSNVSERLLDIGFVFLDEDAVPKANKSYPVISAYDEKLLWLDVPSGIYKLLHLDLLGIYADDFHSVNSKENEGLLKIGINTKDPQNLNTPDRQIATLTNFSIDDGQYAHFPISKSIFRNVIFKDFIHLKFNSFELSRNKHDHFNVLKKVLNGTPEIKNLDILKGLPYLLLVSHFFDSVLNVFGKSQEENNWEEIPSLAIEPIAGNAFLRSGVYVLYEKTNSQKQAVNLEDMAYQEGRLISTNPKTILPNHLLLGIGLGKHVQ